MSSKPLSSLLEGERLILACHASEATNEIRWTKDGVPVNIRANIYSTGNNSTLVIEKVLTSDSGKYSCKAVNKAGSASSFVDITVTGNKDSSYKIWLRFFYVDLMEFSAFSATGIMPVKVNAHDYKCFQQSFWIILELVRNVDQPSRKRKSFAHNRARQIHPAITLN